MCGHSAELHCVLPDTGVQASQAGVEKLKFELTSGLSAAIEEARTNVQERCSSLSVCAMQYFGYGSDFIKSSGLRADPLIQLALQVYLQGRAFTATDLQQHTGSILQTVWRAGP